MQPSGSQRADNRRALERFYGQSALPHGVLSDSSVRSSARSITGETVAEGDMAVGLGWCEP
jgi:hypothetical protein